MISGYSINALVDEDSGSVQNPTIGGSLATLGDSAFLTNTQEIANLPATAHQAHRQNKSHTMRITR